MIRPVLAAVPTPVRSRPAGPVPAGVGSGGIAGAAVGPMALDRRRDTVTPSEGWPSQCLVQIRGTQAHNDALCLRS